MKHFLFLTLIFFMGDFFAQGNLQFNQVKLVSTIESVPVGKVWKVESVMYSSGLSNFAGPSSSQIITQNSSITINSSTNVVRSLVGVNTNGGYTVWEQTYPIWLMAGSTLAASTGVQFISVIEFNIVP
jgi:hypothetical protein